MTESRRNPADNGSDNNPDSVALTTQMVRRPGLCRLTLLVSDTAADIAVTSTVEDNSLLWRHVDFDPACPSPRKGLEKVVYDNPLLFEDFRDTAVVFDTRRQLVVPAEAAGALPDCDEAAAMLEALYPADDNEPIITAVGGGAVIAAVPDAESVRFVKRTFQTAALTTRLAVLVKWFGVNNLTGSTGRIYAHLRPDLTDIVAFGPDGLLMANTFSTPHADDAVYYILAASRSLGYDDTADRLLLSGDPRRREAVLPGLRRYIPHAMPAIFPSALFRTGSDAMRAPLELLALPLCR